jgi:tripartite-type tricarboxylate transporter receptor subunit TctC
MSMETYESLRRVNSPYRGGGPAANDLLSGQIDYMCGNMGTSVARAAAKQSKPLAMLSRERAALMPELATAHEQGMTDYDVSPGRHSSCRRARRKRSSASSTR